LRYIFDQNFSPALPVILRALEMDAVGVLELFGQGWKDEQFIPTLDKHNDTLVTYDKRMRTRPAGARALQEVGVRSLFFGPWWDGKQQWDQAEWLILTWRRVHEQAVLMDPGVWLWVRANGDLAEESEWPAKARIRKRQSRGPWKLQL
jgi:hypothetical protein